MKFFNFNKNKARSQDATQGYMSQRRHILSSKSSFHVQEAYKTLRTNIRFFLPGQGCKKFCLTSGLSGEGKSITSLNLAISFAEAGHRVLLIDGDLRRPSLARLLIEKATPGLSNVLAGLCSEQEAIRKEVYPNLDIMLSGELPPNPSELLGSSRMSQLIENMSKLYDYILVDTAPVGIVSDACVVANVMDGVLFVVHQHTAEKEYVSRGVKQLEFSGARLMGFVFNGVDPDSTRSYRNSFNRSKKLPTDYRQEAES